MSGVRRSQFEPLASRLVDDPVLVDVPKIATVSDIDTLIGVEARIATKLYDLEAEMILNLPVRLGKW